MSGDSSLGIGIGLALKSYGRGFRGLLNRYPGAAAAYSLRKLSGSVSNVVRVRRASDNDEKDFTAAQISSGEMVNWVTEGSATADGFVETWYDQSGNGNDATQSVATAQPKIVAGGVLIADGLDFDGVDDVLGTSLVPPNAATLIGVANWDIEDQTTMIIGARDSTNQRSYLSQTSSGESAIGVASSALSGEDIIAGNDYLLFGIHSGSTRLLSTNGTVASDSAGTAPNNTGYGYSIGALNTAGTDSSFMDGTIAEIIIYDSDQSANREVIEGNINDHYSIYA